MSNVAYGVIGLAVVCVALWGIFTFLGFWWGVGFIAFLMGALSVAKAK